MTSRRQVSPEHYEFGRYMSKARWSSLWHQLDEVRSLKAESVLEIGPGPGLFKRVAEMLGCRVVTLDVDPELGPDYLGSATALPFADGSFDVVCAFQMLEHLPYEQSLRSFSEMARVARHGVVISLPDIRRVWPVSIVLPRIGELRFAIPRPRWRAPKHQFDGEHFWEINKRGFELETVMRDLTVPGWRLAKTYRVFDHQYHRFFVFVPNIGANPE